MAKSHHEKLDGQGYPDGLKGDQISLGAKIICLADAFDAMTSHRPYRHRLSFEKTLKEIRKNINVQFDKQIVAAFFRRCSRKKLKGNFMNRRSSPIWISILIPR